ncbi:MAG: response regulator transcription factor [Thermomicrobiales bacterium]
MHVAVDSPIARADAARGRAVLLVEDETRLGTIIARNLTRRGHHLTVVDSVGQAIAAMSTRLPEVVLLDVNLPDGTGWEVLRWLRANRSRVAVIVYSAVPPSPKRIAELRPDAVLTKPFPMDSLVGLIATVGVADGVAIEEE